MTLSAAAPLPTRITFEPAQNALQLERGATHCKFAVYRSDDVPYTFRTVVLLNATGFDKPVDIVVNDVDVGVAPLRQKWPPKDCGGSGDRVSVAILELCDHETGEYIELDQLKQPLTLKLRFSARLVSD